MNRGRVIGIEVKASATVRAQDLRAPIVSLSLGLPAAAGLERIPLRHGAQAIGLQGWHTGWQNSFKKQLK